MSIVLFKDGESCLYEVNEMAYLLENGWSTSKEGVTNEDEPQADARQKDSTNKEKEDIREEGEGTAHEEIRAAAKAAGIKDWDKKRIKTLKAELNEHQA